MFQKLNWILLRASKFLIAKKNYTNLDQLLKKKVEHSPMALIELHI